MKIGVEAERANIANPTGVEHYAAELIKNLAKLDHVNEYILYFRTKPQDWFLKLPPNFKLKVIPFPKFWTQTRLAFELMIHPVDIFLLPIQALPFFHPRKSIIMAHDIAYEFFTEAFTPFMLFYLKLTTRFGVRFAKKIMSASEATKKDIVRIYKIDPSKIQVTLLAMDPNKYKPLSYGEVQPVLDKYGLVYKKYILFIGTLQPRKNIIRLVDAYIKLRKENRIEEKLIIAGGKGWLWEPIIKKIKESGMGENVKHIGYVDELDKPALYNGAVLTTLPALYEGFGLPPLESMACGTPTVVSNLSSLPEVVGDAGKLVDPKSIDSIAQGILEVLTNQELQKDLSQKGLARSKLFTWEKTARETLAVIESLK